MWRVLTLLPCLVLLSGVHGNCDQLKRCDEKMFLYNTEILFDYLKTNETVVEMCSDATYKSWEQCVEERASSCNDPNVEAERQERKPIIEYLCSLEGRQAATDARESECYKNADDKPQLKEMEQISCKNALNVKIVEMQNSYVDITPGMFCSLYQDMGVCFESAYTEKCGDSTRNFILNLWNARLKGKRPHCFNQVDRGCDQLKQCDEEIFLYNTDILFDYLKAKHVLDEMCSGPAYKSWEQCVEERASSCDDSTIRANRKERIPVIDYLCSLEGRQAARDARESKCYNNPLDKPKLQEIEESCKDEFNEQMQEETTCADHKRMGKCVEREYAHECGDNTRDFFQNLWTAVAKAKWPDCTIQMKDTCRQLSECRNLVTLTSGSSFLGYVHDAADWALLCSDQKRERLTSCVEQHVGGCDDRDLEKDVTSTQRTFVYLCSKQGQQDAFEAAESHCYTNPDIIDQLEELEENCDRISDNKYWIYEDSEQYEIDDQQARVEKYCKSFIDYEKCLADAYEDVCGPKTRNFIQNFINETDYMVECPDMDRNRLSKRKGLLDQLRPTKGGATTRIKFNMTVTAKVSKIDQA